MNSKLLKALLFHGNMLKMNLRHSYDLVYFTTRVPDTSEASATRTTRVRNDKCDTSEKF